MMSESGLRVQLETEIDRIRKHAQRRSRWLELPWGWFGVMQRWRTPVACAVNAGQIGDRGGLAAVEGGSGALLLQ